MFISKDTIKDYKIIQDYIDANFYEIGYDLRIKEIIADPSDNSKPTLDTFELLPGATVFISTVEYLKMPTNLCGWVIPKNSLIRLGLQIEAPIYQPGHETRIFIRVTNISSNTHVLKQGQKIAAIMFAYIDKDVRKYEGKYVNEFDYNGVAEYPKDTIPQLVKVEEKITEIEDLEDSLLSKVITIMTVFVGLFSLININVNFVEQKNIFMMLAYNFISIGSIGFLVGFISILLKKIGRKATSIIFLISTIMIVLACIFIFMFGREM